MNSCNSPKYISDKRKCRYHDRGICHKRNNCEFHHPVEICLDSVCSKGSDCLKRHPRICVFFYTGKKCKFNDKCFFKHISEQFKNENKELKQNNVTLNNTITNLKAKCDLIEKTLSEKNIEVANQVKDKRIQERKMKDLNSKLIKTEFELKDTKQKIADLKQQNDSNKKEKLILEVKIKESIENIKMKDTKIKKLEKETDFFSVTLAAKEEQIEIKNLELIEFEKKTKSLNENHENKNDIKIGEEKLQCDQCNYKFKYQNQIEAHIESQHGGKKKR